MCMIGGNVFAYDCMVNGIYYNLNKEEKTATVTFQKVESTPVYNISHVIIIGYSYKYISDYKGSISISYSNSTPNAYSNSTANSYSNSEILSTKSNYSSEFKICFAISKY